MAKTWEIRDSKIHGKGVFATANLRPNQILGVAIVFTPKNYNYQYGDIVGVDNTGRYPRNFIITKNLGAYVNHQPCPVANIKLVKHGEKYYFVTTDFVYFGQELTINYDCLPPFLEKSKPDYK